MRWVWSRHPAVDAGQRTLGQKAADHMKAVLATWTALGLVVVFIGIWIWTAGFGGDVRPFILLNLCLSCFAALQCFVLLIANKRGEQVAADIAIHTEENTEEIKTLIEQNTTLTEAIKLLTEQVHSHLIKDV